ncbi:MAG: 2,5-diamino-6-(ribosylamino)-4(3H)-pyrimidinone 5'-phosphate reductase [Crenarchaeota archaeon]|nr:2,5-diamino-6-(ribosylamino)-4(3H)-pyrimidinone 5'-phosphate reductase [Thermoproteota archaeon]
MRPWVRIVSACTIDGRIASLTGFSRLSCEHDLKRLHRHRADSDAVMIGARTAQIDDPMLTVRLVPADRQPIRVVVDGRLSCRLDLRLFRTAREIPTIVFTSERADRGKIEKLEKLGVRVEIVGEDRVNLKRALEILYHKYDVKRLLVEGGGTLNMNLLKEGLVDEIYITVTPYVFGSGVSVFNGDGYLDTTTCPRILLRDVIICECGNCVVLHYVVRREGR